MALRLPKIHNLQLDKIPQWVLYVVYTIVYLCALPVFQYQTDVDTLGYLGSAEHYANGNFWGGVNGYWSPLLSWLLAPFIACKIPTVLGLKLINLLGALVGLRYIALLSQQLGLTRLYTTICMLAAMPHLAMFSLCVSTPDVLACVSWMAVAYFALRFFERTSFSNTLTLALAGTISYFAKYYHFYAFGLLLGILLIFIVIKRKPILKAWAQVLIVFLLLTSTWMYALYLKHGIFSPTTAAAHNLYTSEHPHATNHPQIGEKILPLHYENYLYTSWEYVPDYVSMNIVRKEDAVKLTFADRLQQIIPYNIVKGPRYFYLETLLFLFSMFVLIRSGTFRRNPQLFPFLAMIILYPLGYYATFVDYRYLLFCVMSSIILAALALQYSSSSLVKTIFIVLLTGSFLLPFHRINQKGNKGKKQYEMTQYLNGANSLTGKHIVSSPGIWGQAMVLCYQSKAKYYDTLLPEKITPANPELAANGIAYYFCLSSEVTEEMKTLGDITYYDQYALIRLSHQ